MKEADINQAFENFVDKNTPSYGFIVRDEDGSQRVDPLKFKSRFQAEFWLVNVTNAFAMDSEGREIKGAILVDFKGKDDA